MNLPNKLTVLRILLVPVMIVFLLWESLPHHNLIAGLIFGIASFTDMLDGQIACKHNLITDFGKFADPLADKILVNAVFCCFVELRLISSVALILILFREFAVTSIRLVAVENKKVIAANNWGKAKTVSQMIAIIFMFLTQYFLELCSLNIIPIAVTQQMQTVIYVLNNIGVWFSVLLTIISGVIYIKDNFEYVKNA